MYIINRHPEQGNESGGFGAWKSAVDPNAQQEVIDETPIEDPNGELSSEEPEFKTEEKEEDAPTEVTAETGEESTEEESEESNEEEEKKPEEEVKTEGESKEEDDTKAIDLFNELKSKEENKDKTDEEIEALVEEKLNEEASSDFDFKLPGEEEAGEEGEESNSWLDLAEHLGIEKPEEESVDAFKASLEKTINDRVKEATKGFDEYKELTPRSKQLVEMLNEKGEEALSQFLNPVGEIDKFLSMSNEDLLRAEYQAMRDSRTGDRLYSDQDIEDKIEYFKENEKELKHKADFIREDLNKHRANQQEKLLKTFEEEKAFRQEREAKFEQIENEKIISTIESVKDFMNTNLNDKVSAKLKADWESGEMQKALNDPEVIVKSYLFHILGEQGMKNIEKQAFEKGRNKMKAKLHKLPVINGNPESNGRTQQSKSTGGFEGWGQGLRAVQGK